VFDPAITEARLLHPADAVGAGVVEATGRFDQHVEAHQQAEGVFLPGIVDDRVVNDHRAACGQGGIGLAQQHPLRLEIPVVENVAEQQDVGAWQVVLEEVAAVEGDAIRQPEAGDVVLEHRPGLRQVETGAAQVRVRQGDL